MRKGIGLLKFIPGHFRRLSYTALRSGNAERGQESGDRLI